jgi:hypothetical protein
MESFTEARIMKRASSCRLTITHLALAALAFGLAGCGGDDDPAGPVNTDVVGNWTFQVTGTSSSGTSCSLTGMTLTFAQSGNALDGTVSGGTTGALACNPGGGGPFTGTGALGDIEQNGLNVEFTFDGTAGLWTMQGTVSSGGSTMNGTVTFPVNFSSGIEQFAGTWTATRN